MASCSGKSHSLLKLCILLAVSILLDPSSVTAQTCTDGRRILRISDVSNAHGQQWDQAGYPIEICVPAGMACFDPAPNYHTCLPSDANAVVRLWPGVPPVYPITNAHGEQLESSTAGYEPVCLGNLDCNTRLGSCVAGEFCMVKLEDTTNAHFEECDQSNYLYSVCCACSFVVTTSTTSTSTSSTSTSSTSSTVTTTVFVVENKMYTFVVDEGGNVFPLGAAVPNIRPDLGGVWWQMSCPGGNGLGSTCTYPFFRCDLTFGSCVSCMPDYNVGGAVGIYGDLNNDNVGDLAGWVQSSGILYSCELEAQTCPDSMSPDENDYCYNPVYYNWGVCTDGGLIDPDNPLGINECHSSPGGDDYCNLLTEGAKPECWCLPLINLTLDLGQDRTSPWEWHNYSYYFEGPERIWLEDYQTVVDKINLILDRNCDCYGCMIVEDVCKIPLAFTSHFLNESVMYLVNGNITADDINFTYWYVRVVDSVGYGPAFDYADGAHWYIEYDTDPGSAEYDALIPPYCMVCDRQNYASYDFAYPGTGDASDDAMHRLLVRADVDGNGVIGPWILEGPEEVYFDPQSMWFVVDQSARVQTLWGPTTAKLVVWV